MKNSANNLAIKGENWHCRESMGKHCNSNYLQFNLSIALVKLLLLMKIMDKAIIFSISELNFYSLIATLSLLFMPLKILFVIIINAIMN